MSSRCILKKVSIFLVLLVLSTTYTISNAQDVQESGFDPQTNILSIPCIDVAGEFFSLDLIVISTSPVIEFGLAAANPLAISSCTAAVFLNNTLTVYKISAEGGYFEVNFDLINADPVTFRFADAIDITDSVNATGTQQQLQIDPLSNASISPTDFLIITGSGFDPQAELSVLFFNSDGFSIEVPSIEATSTTVKVSVPPFSDNTTGVIGPGTVEVQVVQTSGTVTLISNTATGLQINDLPSFVEPVGARTVAYLNGAIQLLADTQKHQAQLEAIANGDISNTALDATVSKLITNYIAIRNEVESIIDDPGGALEFAQIGGQSLQLNIDTIADIDRLVGALTLQNDEFFRIEGLSQSEAMDRAEQIGGYLTSISSTLGPLFNGDSALTSMALRSKSEAALSVSDLSCVISFPQKVATAMFVIQTLRPTAVTFYADLDKITALDGVNTHEVYGALLSRMVLKFAPTILDTIVPCLGTTLDAVGLFNLGPDAYDAYLREVERQEEIFAAGFRMQVLPETRQSGLCLLNSGLCEADQTADPNTEDPTTEDPTTEDPTTEDPTTEDPTTTEPPATTSPFQGFLSGSWGGVCVNSLLNTSENVSGALSLGIGSNGSFSGSFSGSDSGALNGSVSSVGDFTSVQGSAGEAFWSGTITRSGDSLSGGGTWTSTFQLAGTVNCNGTWSGSGAVGSS